MANEVSVWNKVMSAAMSIPGIKVDRELFLRAELRNYCNKAEMEKALDNPVNVLSKKQIDRLANACINNQTIKVTAISTAAGIPGGLAMAATIPADMGQYYWHVIVLAQKLAYLYGFPDLRDKDGNLTEESQNLITVFVGVMMGVAAANDAIKAVSKAFAQQVAKRLPQKPLTKYAIYRIVKEIAKWLGIKVTKDSFSKGVSKAIPIIGGIFSGGFTLATFRPSAKRLQNKLREQMYEIRTDPRNEDDSSTIEDAEYEEMTDSNKDS